MKTMPLVQPCYNIHVWNEIITESYDWKISCCSTNKNLLTAAEETKATFFESSRLLYMESDRGSYFHNPNLILTVMLMLLWKLCKRICIQVLQFIFKGTAVYSAILFWFGKSYFPFVTMLMINMLRFLHYSTILNNEYTLVFLLCFIKFMTVCIIGV